MILDLWSFAVIVSDLVEFVIYWAEHETLTVSFGLGALTFLILAYCAWRSTDIPHDLPSPPHPPFVITIQGTTTHNGGRRQSLSDVRILTSSPYNRSSRDNRHGFSTNSASPTTDAGIPARAHIPDETTLQQVRDTTPRSALGIHGTRSIFFGLLRRRTAAAHPILPSRPSLRNRFTQGPNLVVYHRIYHPSATPVLPPVALSEITTNGPPISSNSSDPNPISTENSSETLVTVQSSSDSATGGSLQNSQAPGETPTVEVDSCRTLERSYSDSDLTLRELSYDTGELGSENAEKHDGTQSADPTNPMATVTNDDVKFTLKFLNDTQREVTAQFNEKIADFKRNHFAEELGENKIVRLIFNGRVLDNDTKTLRESGIFDRCVVHCLIVTPQPSQQQSQAAGDNHPTQRYGNRSGPRGPEPGMFFVSFMGIILVFLWFICFNFGQQLFTQSAVVSLSVLTAIFLIGLVAFYLPVHPLNQAPN